MRFLTTRSLLLRGMLAAAMIGGGGWHASPALAGGQSPSVRIDGGSLADALRHVARETQTTILFTPALVAGRGAGRQHLKGDASAMLRQLLAGTGLRVRIISAHALLIEAAPLRPPHPPVQPLPPATIASGDIMVTAMRRPTRLADTPVSMIAVTGDELERSRATGMQALAALAPSLTLTAMGAGMNRLSLRGVYAAGEPTVGLYYGSVPVAGPGGSTTDPGLMTPDLMLVDVDRVEVLRGPQGTLFGTNSLAGTVRILFKQPDLVRREGAVTASTALTEGGGPGGSLTAVANIPLLADRLALRAVAWSETRGGVIDNPGLGRSNIDRQTRSGGRLALRWQAAPQWRLDLTGAYQAGRIADAANATVGAGLDQSLAQARIPFTDRLWLGSAEVNGTIGGLQLNLSLAHFDWAPDRWLDFSASESSHRGDAVACTAWIHQGACSAQDMGAFASYVDSQTPAVLEQPFTVRVNSAEMRLSGSGRLTWLLGAFLSRRHDAGSSTALPVDPGSGLVVEGTPPTATRSFETSLDEFALFGDGSWHLRPWLTLSAGGRYFDYRRQAAGFVAIPNPITGPFAATSFQETYRADGAVGRARIELRPHQRLLIFGQISSGFRPGGINVVPGLDPALAAYRDDRLTSWEGGGRLRLHGDRLRIDVAAYHQLWSRMQYAATTTDGSYSFITNIGSARIDGGEISLNWQPGRHLLARLDATLTDARLASDQVNAIAVTPGKRGDRLPNVAPLAASFELAWDHAVARNLVLLASLNAHYAGRAYDSFRGSADGPRQAMGDNATLDVDLGLRRGPSQIDLFVQNLADSRAIIWTGRGLSTDSLQRARPRSIGLSLRHNF
ncbi:TonB-dependent receptor domain-containing protein [Novosphingobium terrae]|uniref:TonB-dependent receptor domain-containing protein n=1 Tax=Novosphingobium terrae TaxID=2726189 RepID=UPI00197DFC25|nr:TonB-dependent receptor [Novosphingobium terrae]